MQRIAESELIINPRGAIYHLDLRPEELAETVLLVGDPFRVKQISKHFDKLEHEGQHREFISHTGRLGKKRISVVSTGIGPDNIDIVLNELDALANIDFTSRLVYENLKPLTLIRIGTSGSLQADIPVDSFVTSTHGLGLDNLLHFYQHQPNEEENSLLQSFVTATQLHPEVCHPYISTASPSLLKHFVKGYHHGITITCPGFYGPQGRVLRLGLKNPGLIPFLTRFSFGQHRVANFEMETSAIYGLGRLLGHHCLSLNAIVANRVVHQFSKNGALAVENLIKHSLDIISSI